MTIQASTTMANELGAYLSREIKQRGWSQRKASETWDVPYTTLNNVVHGRNLPDLPTLRKLADGLKVSIVRLIELAGFGNTSAEGIKTPDPLTALTDEDREFIDSLSRDELLELIDFARRQRQRYQS